MGAAEEAWAQLEAAEVRQQADHRAGCHPCHRYAGRLLLSKLPCVREAQVQPSARQPHLPSAQPACTAGRRVGALPPLPQEHQSARPQMPVLAALRCLACLAAQPACWLRCLAVALPRELRAAAAWVVVAEAQGPAALLLAALHGLTLLGGAAARLTAACEARGSHSAAQQRANAYWGMGKCLVAMATPQ